ncbi:hypothetical protein B0A52_02090 [Exophiala mesophila]|uniref:Xylanolytic transcriptional activator regulatory domain-containing protein n=1 Tax=Exophiala mesophila TaxID=212818 RepID=A0A438NEU7_EXOME|nr:hypothetical protein B0A52_02090 [Exophiala mesophila]
MEFIQVDQLLLSRALEEQEPVPVIALVRRLSPQGRITDSAEDELDNIQNDSATGMSPHTFTFINHCIEGPATTASNVSTLHQETSQDRQEEQEHSSVYATDTLNLEYYGPRCFLSFSSQPGVKWINSKVRSTEFSNVAMRVVTDMAQMLKMSRTPSTVREPEPTVEAARAYTEAYFEEAPETAFNIVDRSWFESRLRAHRSGSTPEDKAWYALRNVLWASGCRIQLSKRDNYTQVSRASWALFENALSVQTEVQFLRASIVAVQALILMAYFAEGVGKTSLQYMLCSTAMRLACSKGLHRQAPKSWKISSHEVKHRNWMFWSIYCLEKQICTRSGRPSAIDDDEISTLLPQSTLTNRPGDIAYCHILVDLMQLCSTARKRLSSARALQQSPEQLIQAVSSLVRELDNIKDRAMRRYKFSLDGPLDLSQLPTLGLTLLQAQSLKANYCCLVLDINTPLSYPWSGIHLHAEQDPVAFAQVEKSCAAVAEAARCAILATRQIQVDASCTALVSLYTPVYSSVNLFIQILRDTSATSTKSDLIVLAMKLGLIKVHTDIALGYFSSLELVTNLELSLSFARDMCHFARLAVDSNNKALEKDNVGQSHSHVIAAQPLLEMSTDNFPNEPPGFGFDENDFFGSLPDETFEMWSTLLPFTATDDFNFSA